MHGEYFGNSEKQHFSCYTTVVIFGQLLKKFGLLFNSASGHSALGRSCCSSPSIEELNTS